MAFQPEEKDDSQELALDLEPQPRPDYHAIVRKIAADMPDEPDTTKTETPSEPSLDPESLTRASLLWRESRVSERHRDFMPEHSLSLEWTAQWLRLSGALGSGVIAVILGSRGAGKSQMAVCAIRQTCKGQKSARYVKAFDFFLSIRSTYRKDSQESESDIIQQYVEPRLLVIDAIENRSDSAFENLMLNHLIDLRYDACKDTLLIGNVDELGFAASMGPSIVDRIHECGIKIVCNWHSFRRAGAKEDKK